MTKEEIEKQMHINYDEGYKAGCTETIKKVCKFMQSCEGYVVSGEKCNYENL